MACNLECSSESSRFVKIPIAGLHPRVSVSEDLGWGSRICISNKLLGDADAIGSETPH